MKGFSDDSLDESEEPNFLSERPQQQNTQNKTQHFGRFHTTLSLAQRGSFSVAKSARLLENSTSGFLEKVETPLKLSSAKAQFASTCASVSFIS